MVEATQRETTPRITSGECRAIEKKFSFRAPEIPTVTLGTFRRCTDTLEAHEKEIGVLRPVVEAVVEEFRCVIKLQGTSGEDFKTADHQHLVACVKTGRAVERYLAQTGQAVAVPPSAASSET